MNLMFPQNERMIVVRRILLSLILSVVLLTAFFGSAFAQGGERSHSACLGDYISGQAKTQGSVLGHYISGLAQNPDFDAGAFVSEWARTCIPPGS
jgi:hypothetical protein